MKQGFVFAAMAVIAAGCSNDSLPSEQDTTVDDEGGTVEIGTSSGSTELDIPAGAVEEPTDITVSEVDESTIANLPGDGAGVSAPVAFTPHGLTFDQPVTISFTIDGDVPAGAAIARLEDEQDESWEFLTTTVTGKVVSTDVQSFSIYRVIDRGCTDNDPDSDGDGVCDSEDACPSDAPDDTDGDGICNSDDACPDSAANDANQNGTCDVDEASITGVLAFFGGPGQDDNPVSQGTVYLYQGQQQLDTTTTNASGEYSFSALAPGSYNVSAQIECVASEDITLTAGLDATVDLLLCEF